MTKSKTASNPIKATLGKKAKITTETKTTDTPVVNVTVKVEKPAEEQPVAKAEVKEHFAKPPVIPKTPAKEVEAKTIVPVKTPRVKPPKPVIKAAVDPTPPPVPPAPKRGTVEASLSKLRKVADEAVAGEPSEKTIEVEVTVKEVDNRHPEAMVRKPPVVAKKAPPPQSGKLSFDSLVAANREQQLPPAPLFDAMKYIKK